MERQEIDQLLSLVEAILTPKIETFVDYLDLCPLPNLLRFQECVNELIEIKKNGMQTPDIKHREWYVDDGTKYIDLKKKYIDLEKKYIDLAEEHLATLKKYVELKSQSASLS